MRPLIAVILLLCLPANAYADKLKVVASFSIVGDMVKTIGGDAIDLTTLVGPDEDAHAYEPTPADAKTIADADIVIVNGLGLEGWMGKLVTSSGYTGPVISAIEKVTPLDFSDEGLSQDPHAWQSLKNAKLYVTTICDALVKNDPEHAAAYRASAEKYLAQLDKLDIWTKKEIGRIPPERRKVITSHDAFAYFGKEYGVTFIAPQGISTDSQPSAAHVAQLIDQIRHDNVQALFFENMTDTRLIKQLQTDANAHIGSTLYSDALSPAGGPAPTYLAMFQYNVSQLVNGMQYNQ